MGSKKKTTSTTATSKKSWSKHQEISILNAMIEFSAQGLDPAAYMNDFYAFMKKSCDVDFTKNELRKKLEKLKEKYIANLIRVDIISDDDEKKIFSLSQKIWGAGGAFVSPEATSELCLQGMTKFHENYLGLEEDVINKRLKFMDNEKGEEYKRKLREIEVLEIELNRKRAQIVDSQMKVFLDAYGEIQHND